MALEAAQGKEIDSPLEPLEGAKHFDFDSVKLILDFGPPEP